MPEKENHFILEHVCQFVMYIIKGQGKYYVGDEIFINYDNIKYKYRVEEMYEVKPTNLSVLDQRFDGRYLTLITCSPPGTYLRRLVVKAHLVDI